MKKQAASKSMVKKNMFVFLSHHMIGMYGIKYIVTS